MRRSLILTAVAGAVLLLPGKPAAAEKKKKEEATQTLELPKDPPQVATGEARRLVFHVSPLSARGLLTQQTRDAAKALLKDNGGASVIHIRAFVAGSGDVRRVPQIISEVFTEKKLPLPSISVVLTGGLAMENAQVVLETISVAKRDVNPGGVEFITSDAVTAGDPLSPVAPLLQQAMDGLTAKLHGAAPLMVTCFVSNLSGAGSPATKFGGAVTNIVQTQRGPYQAYALCEGAAKATSAAPEKLAFTGTRVAFGGEESNAKQAFQRLDRDLAEAGAGAILLTHFYPLTMQGGEMARKLRDPKGAVAVIPAEGLASVDAGFAIDAVAAVAH